MSETPSRGLPIADAEVRCEDLSRAVDSFVEQGLRLDAIFPADDPREAWMSKPGSSLHLIREASPSPRGGWVEGRAGMHYRDLILDRLGGRCIASHIRILAGGPVADYVHWHEVEFQLIHCHRGWVKVVYEDQGPAIVMEAGDCVLQPPGIRHRVLECSPGLEVIEVGCPAEHLTRVDHQLELPTAVVDPARAFAGQRFVHHRAASASWAPSGGWMVRDLGVEAASGGIASARVARADSGPLEAEIRRTTFGFVLRGRARLGLEPVEVGSAFVLDPHESHCFDELSTDFQWLAVELPDQARAAST